MKQHLISSISDKTDHTPQSVVVLPAGFEASFAKLKEQLRNHDVKWWPVYDELIKNADRALQVGPFSVVVDERLAPSGDPHDYTSLGPYWWPNPNTPDGLPYIRRDGDRNPESLGGDWAALQDMSNTVCLLTVAWGLSQREDYAQHAAHLLRTFFLDAATRMNPHLNFAQRIPGVCDGRGIGIIDTHCLVQVVQVVSVLRQSQVWTQEDQSGMETWFAQFLDWLEQSPLGRKERREHNNHGTWYDLQFVAFALFVGQNDRACSVLEQVPKQRIASHIEPDGSQPHELARTLSFTYSVFNLQALVALAQLGEYVGVDLLHDDDGHGRSLLAATAFLAPYLIEPDTWPYTQIKPIVPHKFAPLFRLMNGLCDERLSDLLDKQSKTSLGRSHPALAAPYDVLGMGRDDIATIEFVLSVASVYA